MSEVTLYCLLWQGLNDIIEEGGFAGRDHAPSTSPTSGEGRCVGGEVAGGLLSSSARRLPHILNLLLPSLAGAR